MSKFKSYAWQDEFRIIFCQTDALGFEKGVVRLVKGEAGQGPKPAEHHLPIARVLNFSALF
jgi:hypothetical protein